MLRRRVENARARHFQRVHARLNSAQFLAERTLNVVELRVGFLCATNGALQLRVNQVRQSRRVRRRC